MSKGYTRRPAFVDRKAYDEAYERTFHGKHTSSDTLAAAENGAVIGENGEVARAEDEAHSEAKSREATVRACRLAEVMELGFGDQRSRA